MAQAGLALPSVFALVALTVSPHIGEAEQSRKAP
jgi:hypothetical protein